MKSIHTSTRKSSNKKIAGTKVTSYPPEECFRPEFIKEVELAEQEVLEGKGIKFKSVDAMFDYLRK